ncbi:hypothetical protein NHX12_008233, partial [Muraenolepis orangiensis]
GSKVRGRSRRYPLVHRAGLLALRPKRTPAAGVSPHGGGPGGSGLCAQSGGKAQLEAEAPLLP